jgi:hypothetical protein
MVQYLVSVSAQFDGPIEVVWLNERGVVKDFKVTRVIGATNVNADKRYFGVAVWRLILY